MRICWRESNFWNRPIGRLERAVYNPTVLVLSAIAAALKVSIVELLRGQTK